MRILVPEHIYKRVAVEIKNISADVQIAELKIVETENIFRKFLRRLLSSYFPYWFYKRLHNFIKPAKKYKFLIDDCGLFEPVADIEVFLTTWKINREIFEQILDYLPNLRWVHSTMTGVDYLKIERLIKNNVILTSSKGVHSKRVAEFAIALIFVFAKRIPEHLALQRSRRWKELLSLELAGKTVGILGVGNIGREIAKLAKALGMNVIGFDTTPIGHECVDQIFCQGELSKVLEASDFVVNCLPLTVATRDLLKEKELSYLKPTAFFINISRAEIVNEESLLWAIKNKSFAGIAIDAFNHDYIPRNLPFYKFNNLLITHHSAFSSENATKEILQRFLYNFRLFLNRQPLLGEVDKILEY